MVDIHSHILPALDDGAETAEAAIAMVRMAAAGGTTDIVATPHASPEFPYDPVQAGEKLAELGESCRGVIHIHSGCELHLSFEGVRDALREPSRYTINGGKYVLVELPEFFHAAGMEEAFRVIEAAGMTPIITHPERHPYIQKRIDVLRGWVEKNCLVQVTAQSVLGSFGRAAEKASAKLLGEALVHFIASDAHDTEHRPPLLCDAYFHVEKRYGGELAATLFVTNPRATLTGAPVIRPPKPKSRWTWQC